MICIVRQIEIIDYKIDYAPLIIAIMDYEIFPISHHYWL